MAEADDSVVAALAELDTRIVEQDEMLDQLRRCCVSLEKSQLELRRDFDHLVNQSFLDTGELESAPSPFVAKDLGTSDPRPACPAGVYLDLLHELWLSAVLADTYFVFMDESAARNFRATSRACCECRRGFEQSLNLRGKYWKCPVKFSSMMPHGGHYESQVSAGYDRSETGACMSHGVQMRSDTDPWRLRKALAPMRRRAMCSHEQRALVRVIRARSDGEKVSNRVLQHPSETNSQARQDLVSASGTIPRSKEASFRKRLISGGA